jgi:hypothetical protein
MIAGFSMVSKQSVDFACFIYDSNGKYIFSRRVIPLLKSLFGGFDAVVEVDFSVLWSSNQKKNQLSAVSSLHEVKKVVYRSRQAICSVRFTSFRVEARGAVRRMSVAIVGIGYFEIAELRRQKL